MLLIGYTTKEGQSRKIARWCADRLAGAGKAIELLSLKDASDVDLTRFDGAILIAPVHVGRFPKPLIAFANAQADALNEMPSLFLSVSLAASGHDADDWRGIEKVAVDLSDATGWTPGRTEHVAGAYQPSKYDLLTKFIMKRIIAEKDPGSDLNADREYTDWEALGQTIDDWTPG
ncbi:MAG: flavodoxin domain-containing protein [Pseudomonadota bacterium]